MAYGYGSGSTLGIEDFPGFEINFVVFPVPLGGLEEELPDLDFDGDLWIDFIVALGCEKGSIEI